MEISVTCGTCGGPCRGHAYRCMDCGRYGSHDPSVDHVISCHLNEQIAVELEALRKDLPVE